MGDIDGGRAGLLMQPLDLDPHVDAELGVQVRERLIEQKDARLAHQSAAHGDALTLAAGELTGAPFEQMLDLQRLGDDGHRLVALVLRTLRISMPKAMFSATDMLG
jgi:hypothetical protein